MGNLKVTIIGNSVALRVRPPQKYPDNKNYTRQLEEILQEEIKDKTIIIENKSQGALTICGITSSSDEFIRSFPDYYVLNIGIVDSCSREVPLWFYRLANSQKDNIFYNFFSFLYRRIIVRIRPLLVYIRGKKGWICIKKFKRHFKYLMQTLLKETNARVIVIPINALSDRIEKELPGSKKNRLKFNQVIEAITNDFLQYYIDLGNIKDNHVPDGIHFSKEGHTYIAQKLASVIIKDQKVNLKNAR
jgi:lysophospholipase L1-like esterase